MKNCLHHPLHCTWREMHRRCREKTRRDYKNYGGRGISVCPEWSHFWTFVFDMGPRPQGLTLDRINNDGNYEPSNCRWTTMDEQNLNKRIKRTHFIEFAGLRLNVKQWAKRLGISPPAMSHRIKKHGEQKAVAMGSRSRE